MTDYKRVLRSSRRLTTDHTNIYFTILLMILVLGAMSMAGKEDMKSRMVIDQATKSEKPLLVVGR